MSDNETVEEVSETEVAETVSETTETTAQDKGAGDDTTDKTADTTIAQGAEEKAEEVTEKPAYWPDDWREKLAEHMSAGDKKTYDKELRRLKNVSDPTGVYGLYREMEAKFSQGGLTKIPGEDASEEDRMAFYKQLGGPEKPEELLEDLKLRDDAVLGDADKPVAEDFAKALHGAVTPQEVMNRAIDWYFANQEEAAARMDEMDESFKSKSMAELKEELGPSFRRKMNSISSLFAEAPGGADLQNENATMARLLGGRLADGVRTGDDPDVARLMMRWAAELHPTASVVDDTASSIKGVETEIKEIETVMRTDRATYNKDTAMQNRLLELYDARERNRARNAA